MDQTTIGAPTGATAEREPPRERVESTRGSARTAMYRAMDRRKDQVCEGLDQLSDTLRSSGDGVSHRLSESAAGYAKKASSYLRGHSSEELFDSTVSEIKERPGLLLAGCFALGFFGARLLRS